MAPPATRRAALTSPHVTDPLLPSVGLKRKERDFENATSKMNRVSENETKVDVFVRCRGRNEQEVRENSAVVVMTNGVKGNTVELSMGSNATTNKTYSFDRVFSPLADQQMIFDEVVEPVLNEVLKGFNCTIFAYGQTGTGKTYTMSGDISDQPLLSDDAGIIPRALHFLFRNLSARSDSSTNCTISDSSIKVSFIELYNEELRDLLSLDDKVNLKIFDGDSRRGAATIVQGRKEQYISNAKTGIRLLRNGSHIRQVAATNCNDLSSRSHAIFTISVFEKRTLPSGEEILSTGKLNLVDLAGSENIGRSGAEKKRAVEAGLINKSLLTLGRVINALVDRSTHIPYRESKLTRLLQDSLGGQTKTCILATLSSSRSNLEETISTLDYAFRAKDIRNKPQVTNLIPRKALLKDMTIEIERLESELAATRQRNGVYLTHEAYEELKMENESQKTLIKEQREKNEMIESKLARKSQDLLGLSSQFEILNNDNEKTKDMLEKEILARRQHERAEQKLTNANHILVTSLHQSTADIGSLQLKMQRQSELHVRNRDKYGWIQRDIVDSTTLVDDRLKKFQIEQQRLLDMLLQRMDAFIELELDKLDKARIDLKEKSKLFEQTQIGVIGQMTQSETELEKLLGEIKTLKEELQGKLGTGLDALRLVARRIPDGIISEMESFKTQVQSSYSNLSMDFRTTLDDMAKEIREQQEEIQRLWGQMIKANHHLEQNQSHSLNSLSDLVEQEKIVRDQENKDLMQCMQELVDANMLRQESRFGAIAELSAQLKSTRQSHLVAGVSFTKAKEEHLGWSRTLSNKLVKSRDMMETRIQNDAVVANKYTEDLKVTTSSVYNDISQMAKEQMQNLDTDMRSLETVVDHAQEQNNIVHIATEQSFPSLIATVQDSYGNLANTFTAASDRFGAFNNDVTEQRNNLHEHIPHLHEDALIRSQLIDLKGRVENNKMEEYLHTGQTPTQKAYNCPTTVPGESNRDTHADCMAKGGAWVESAPVSRPKAAIPVKTFVLADNQGIPTEGVGNSNVVMPTTHSRSPRELDVNTINNSNMSKSDITRLDKITLRERGTSSSNTPAPHISLKRPASALNESKSSFKKARPRCTTVASNLLTANTATLADSENLPVLNLSASMGHGVGAAVERRLRSHGRGK